MIAACLSGSLSVCVICLCCCPAACVCGARMLLQVCTHVCMHVCVCMCAVGDGVVRHLQIVRCAGDGSTVMLLHPAVAAPGPCPSSSCCSSCGRDGCCGARARSCHQLCTILPPNAADPTTVNKYSAARPAGDCCSAGTAQRVPAPNQPAAVLAPSAAPTSTCGHVWKPSATRSQVCAPAGWRGGGGGEAGRPAARPSQRLSTC